MMKRLAAALTLATMIAIAACSNSATTSPTLPSVSAPTTTEQPTMSEAPLPT